MDLDYDKIERRALEIMHANQTQTIRSYQAGFRFVWPSLPKRVRAGLHTLLAQTGDEFDMGPRK